jgi:preprotein translocase subunit SecY
MLFTYIVFALVALAVIMGVIYISEAQRNIPINYARRVRGMRQYGGVSTYLPMRVNNAGVIPIISRCLCSPASSRTSRRPTWPSWRKSRPW